MLAKLSLYITFSYIRFNSNAFTLVLALFLPRLIAIIVICTLSALLIVIDSEWYTRIIGKEWSAYGCLLRYKMKCQILELYPVIMIWIGHLENVRVLVLNINWILTRLTYVINLNSLAWSLTIFIVEGIELYLGYLEMLRDCHWCVIW